MATSPYDVAVVGAGPAGLAAAGAALAHGGRVALIDAGRQPGGQYWRHRPGDLGAVADLHHDLGAFRALVAGVAGAVRYFGHHVWNVSGSVADGFTVRSVAGDSEQSEQEIAATSLVLAPGAYDRQVPFRSWDLPGVYTAGGAQALLKGNEVVVGRRVVVGGTGPFLLPVAAGLAARGARVVGVYEANGPLGWVRHTGAVLPVAAKLTEGAGYAAALVRHRVPFRSRRAIVAAHGDGALEAVTVARLDAEWRIVAGTERVVECDAAAVGWGFTPQLELPLALGVATRVDADGSLVVAVDEHQLTSVPGVFVAGEACGVGGAALAVAEGEIAGAAAAVTATGGTPAPAPPRLHRRRRALRRFATAMHTVHPVRDGWQTWLRDDTLVCRCEEVTAGEVKAAVDDLGATDARTAKLLSRAGMGWCQGRVCGYATACLTASARESASASAPDLQGVSERPIAAPISLGRLAGDAGHIGQQ
ncbi:FAD/NAD(P)-binding oxidoreductase [Jiangella ureilytica]|uniref:FAD/NAD(P)-binding oxidoreductase n=1 Tax=Jiangella ureilytica TaxID=2530374 RepID=A0A4R4RIW4_9ACTN|nr:(2Fe-2S)-binding protein [Jiangella ureilytica]TDC48859.1 FAD/NAD(P)-binding oxidoreductase [Jiangella ureilytica]